MSLTMVKYLIAFIKYISNASIGLESSDSFEIKCVKCNCIILSTELIDRNFRLFAITPERAFFTYVTIFKF